MADSVSESLRDAVASAISALALSGVAGVLKRKLPEVSEGIDDELPAVFVTPSELTGVDHPFDSMGDGRRYREYRIQVVIVTASDGDNRGGLTRLEDWRQRIWRRLGRIDPLPEVGELLLPQIDPGAVIDRDAHARNYDYSPVCGLRLGCVEPAGDE